MITVIIHIINYPMIQRKERGGREILRAEYREPKEEEKWEPFWSKREVVFFFRDQALKNQVSGMILELKIDMHLRFMVLLLLGSCMISVQSHSFSSMKAFFHNLLL